MSKQCKAQDPAKCRYHQDNAYFKAAQEVALIEASIIRSSTYSEIEVLRNKLQQLLAKMDSTNRGYRALKKLLVSREPKAEARKELEARLETAEKLRSEVLKAERREKTDSALSKSISHDAGLPVKSQASTSVPDANKPAKKPGKSLQDVARKIRVKQRRKAQEELLRWRENNEQMKPSYPLRNFSDRSY